MITVEEPRWRAVWRSGIAPQMSTAALQALLRALEGDDPHLIQGYTSVPSLVGEDDVPALLSDEPRNSRQPIGCCPIGYGAWKGDGLRTCGQVEGYFAAVAVACGDYMRDAAAIRHFTCWVDETPRRQMVAALIPEVVRELERRQTC